MAEMSEGKKRQLANLTKPFTKETAAEMGRRGGIAAQKAIAKKKHLKDSLKVILALEPSDRNKPKLADLGIPEDQMTNEMLMAVAMFNKAIKGDVRAAEYIRDLTGQQPQSKLDRAKTNLMNAQAKALTEQTNGGKSELTKLDELLKGIDRLAEDDNGTK